MPNLTCLRLILYRLEDSGCVFSYGINHQKISFEARKSRFSCFSRSFLRLSSILSSVDFHGVFFHRFLSKPIEISKNCFEIRFQRYLGVSIDNGEGCLNSAHSSWENTPTTALKSRGSVNIVNCTFLRCYEINGNGGALSVDSLDTNVAIFIKESIFELCGAAQNGGAVFIDCKGIVEISVVWFKNCSCTLKGSSAYIISYNTTIHQMFSSLANNQSVFLESDNIRITRSVFNCNNDLNYDVELICSKSISIIYSDFISESSSRAMSLCVSGSVSSIVLSEISFHGNISGFLLPFLPSYSGIYANSNIVFIPNISTIILKSRTPSPQATLKPLLTPTRAFPTISATPEETSFFTSFSLFFYITLGVFILGFISLLIFGTQTYFYSYESEKTINRLSL